jgi:CBS domain-containing protein
MKISDILRHKSGGRDRPAVVTTAPTATIAALLATLAEHNIGAVVVVDGNGDGGGDGGGDTVRGIVSERDIVRRLASVGADLLDQAVADVMTSEVVSCTGDDSIDDVARTMTDRRIRHMPVIDDGTLVGVVSIGDVVSSRMRQLEQDRGQLEQYIAG